MKATYCADCKWVHEDTRGAQPYRWLCSRHPRLNEGFGFVTDRTWDNAEPYLKCSQVNAGACPLFEERKET